MIGRVCVILFLLGTFHLWPPLDPAMSQPHSQETNHVSYQSLKYLFSQGNLHWSKPIAILKTWTQYYKQIEWTAVQSCWCKKHKAVWLKFKFSTLEHAKTTCTIRRVQRIYIWRLTKNHFQTQVILYGSLLGRVIHHYLSFVDSRLTVFFPIPWARPLEVMWKVTLISALCSSQLGEAVLCLKCGPKKCYISL